MPSLRGPPHGGLPFGFPLKPQKGVPSTSRKGATLGRSGKVIGRRSNQRPASPPGVWLAFCWGVPLGKSSHPLLSVTTNPADGARRSSRV